MKTQLSFCAFALSLLLLGACRNDNTPANPQNGTTNTPPDTTQEPQTDSEGVTEDYENTNRVIWQKPDLVLNLLGNLKGKTVADIGAGTGFFALRMAQKADKVIAIDVDPRFTSYLDSVKVLELPEHLQSRLETRLAAANDPKLGNEEVDVIVIVNTFMYLPRQVEYLRTLKKGLKPGGKLLIIDFKKKRTPVGPPLEIRTDLHTAEEALYKAGFRNIVANDTTLDYQYILTAQK
ncbi:MAG: class I SAM-dependent methyltransferase [Saprospiraceae bacterium]|nr:class I SAM-dependent methyltransferase [Saprospiraceae bacterium]